MSRSENTLQGRRLLVDVSGLAYASAYRLSDLRDRRGNRSGAIFGVLRSLETLVVEAEPTEVVICWDEGSYARKLLFGPYKQNRKRDPEFYADFKRQCTELRGALDYLPVVQVSQPGVEADDVIARLCEFLHLERVGIVTSDRDLYQLAKPPLHVIVSPKTKDVVRLTMRPLQYLTYKVIVGDPSDNIPGIPGVGKVTASRLLNEHVTLKRIMAVAKEEGKIGRASYADAKAIVKRNLGLMRLGRVLSSEERSEIARAYKTRRLSLSTSVSDFRTFAMRYGFTSIVKRLSRFLAPFRALERGRNAEDENDGGPQSAPGRRAAEAKRKPKRKRAAASVAPGDAAGAGRRPVVDGDEAAEAALLDGDGRPVHRVASSGRAADNGARGQNAPTWTRRIRRLDPAHTVVERWTRRVRKVVATDEPAGFRSNADRSRERRRASESESTLRVLAAFAEGDGWKWLKKRPAEDLRRVRDLISSIEGDETFAFSDADTEFLGNLHWDWTTELPEWANP
jgi:5'-3' exonuclease